MADLEQVKSFYRDILKMIYPNKTGQVLEQEVEKLAKSRTGINFKSAWDKIEDKAEKVVKKSRGHITKQQAVNEVLQKNPQLYNEYLKEDNKVIEDNDNVNKNVNKESNNIWDKIQQLAEKEQRKNPKLTREQAIQQVLKSKQGIELYNQYLMEKE